MPNLSPGESQAHNPFLVVASLDVAPTTTGPDDPHDLIVYNLGLDGSTRGLYHLDDTGSWQLVLSDDMLRGGATSTSARLSVISNFASPNAGGIVSGHYYDNAFQGTASSTLAGAANRWDQAPFYTSATLAVDQIGIAVSTAVASSQVKITIYDSDTSGWPNNLLYEGAALDCSSTGYKSNADSFTFNPGKQYWLGVRHSSTCTLRSINVSSAVNLGLSSSTATSYYSVVRRTLTFATAATDPFVFTSTDLAAATPPSIRMRAA